MKRFNRRRRLAAVSLVALGVAASAYAFTASNTVPASSAGIGSGTISGYTVSGVAYTLNASDPSRIAAVAFTLDAAATQVQAKVVSSSATYQACTVSGGTNVTCTFPAASQPTVLSADQLSVVATS